MEYLIRFLAGGIVVSAFAVLGDVLRPKSFAGLFGAAPSVALATLSLALWKEGGDYVSIDIKGSRDGEALEGLTADDYLYEVGRGAIAPGLDEQLRGAKAGDILAFDAEVPGLWNTARHNGVLLAKATTPWWSSSQRVPTSSTRSR